MIALNPALDTLDATPQVVKNVERLFGNLKRCYVLRRVGASSGEREKRKGEWGMR